MANEGSRAVLDEVSKVIVGKGDVLEEVLLAILCDGHVLIEDYPGLAKTLMAKTFAAALGLRFKRVQFTSDLLPADVTGSYVLDRGLSKFELRQGPIFTNVLLADEINRAPPRTQSALLEAMQERQVTIENETLKLERPFIVLATQNPIEHEGTYPLPEAQLDRFLMKIGVGYPSAAEEVEVLERRIKRAADDAVVNAVATPASVLGMQAEVEKVHVDPAIERYIVEVSAKTREHRSVEVGVSPRGSLAVMKLSRARAWMEGRNFVIPDDVKFVAIPALCHRIILKPEQWLRGTQAATVISDVLAEVPVPKVS